MLAAYGGSTFYSELQSAVEQLCKRLPEETQLDLQAIANQRVIFHPGSSVHLNPEVWQKLEFACHISQSVKIRYFTATRNTESERIVDPYILTFIRTNPYMTGFCHWRQKILDFRIDRIRDIEVLPETFEVDPAFDPKTHLTKPFLHEKGGEPTPVVIWFDTQTSPYIRERHWHDTQEIEEHPDGSLTLRVMARGLNEVKRWVMFYGKGAMVKAPLELIRMIYAEVAEMKIYYSEEVRND